MRNIAVTAAGVILLAACSQLVGPVFTAEQQRYLDALRQSDNSLISAITDMDLVETGVQVCDAGANGTINDATVVAAESLDQDAYNNPDERLVIDYVRLVVVQALTQLCPAQKGLLDS